MTRRPLFASTLLLALGVSAGCTRAPAESMEIVLPGTRVFPESITSTSDGTLIVGSLGQNNVLRIAPGSTTAVEWIAPGTGGLNAVLGVYADEASQTLWVCSNRLAGTGEATALMAFGLDGAAIKGTYPLPGGDGSLCNDIAVGADGTAYVADTRQGAVFMLKPGAAELELAAQDSLLATADGLAFGDPTVLYVNGLNTGKLLRLDLGDDGKAARITDVELSTPLEFPDGMRALGNHRLLLAENVGRLSVIEVHGPEFPRATVTPIKSGLPATPAATVARGLAWIVEGKLQLMADSTQDPGPFTLHGVPLPRN